MKTPYVCGVLVLAAVLLTACATPADIQTTLDPQANLGSYRSFMFLDSGAQTPGAITDANVNMRLRHMIAAQLSKRGYPPAAPGQTADLGVHYSAQVVPKQSVLIVGRPGAYSYGWGSTELGGYDTQNYRQGTLFIDLVDLAGNRLLWRARVSDAYSASYSDDNWIKVERALDEAFKNVPQRR